jgi:hypothetical protein
MDKEKWLSPKTHMISTDFYMWTRMADPKPVRLFLISADVKGRMTEPKLI